MAPTVAKSGHLRAARVLHEDGGYVTLEVAKDQQRKLEVQDGDQFLTVVFIHAVGQGRLRRWVSWLPWSDR